MICAKATVVRTAIFNWRVESLGHVARFEISSASLVIGNIGRDKYLLISMLKTMLEHVDRVVFEYYLRINKLETTSA